MQGHVKGQHACPCMLMVLLRDRVSLCEFCDLGILPERWGLKTSPVKQKAKRSGSAARGQALRDLRGEGHWCFSGLESLSGIDNENVASEPMWRLDSGAASKLLAR